MATLHFAIRIFQCYNPGQLAKIAKGNRSVCRQVDVSTTLAVILHHEAKKRVRDQTVDRINRRSLNTH